MKTKDGWKPIEEIKVGDWVLSRDERTGAQAYKRVVETFVTRPDHLVTLRYRPVKGGRERRSAATRSSSRDGGSEDGSGSSEDDERTPVSHGETGAREGWTPSFALPGADQDSSLTGTAVHPFWSEDRQAWVDMGALRPCEHLRLSDGSAAVVTGMAWQFAEAGERYTTYNFEVEDWHTYFVRHTGNFEVEDWHAYFVGRDRAWVWVHNTGNPCAEGAVIGLGLDHRLMNLRRLGASTYDQWFSKGLTRVRPERANLDAFEFRSAFMDSAEKAKRIIVDLTDLDIDRALEQGVKGFTRHNYTNAELYIILQNPDLLKKAVFLGPMLNTRFP